ncbi:MAG: glutamate-5-semialdehyde dehydrogenase [Acidobacteria bacterium]|nr:glutamate-5-semialdehyde dehydrogenase [Acidobacteriota bacterium]MBS1866004.1 glutamate-5-semialdehyde dehydrogenase [Acidobacteriota bacterium]
MSNAPASAAKSSVREQARAARAAARKLALLSNEARNSLLLGVARRTEQNAAKILAANAEDCRAAEGFVKNGELSQAAFARLRVTENTIREMVMRLEEVARLEDPIGKRLATTELDDGLILYKESCPLGVVAVIFESRPDVVPQVSGLAVKSGNAVLLKGGAEAVRTNEALVALWRETLRESGIAPEAAVTLLQSRADVMELLQLKREVDLIVPRGGREFVEHISANSRVPVLGHGEGICHVYVDRAADLAKAEAIALDAKTQYPAACNSAETLLVHADVAAKFLPGLAKKLKEASVELRGDERTREILRGVDVVKATEADWATEYSDLILAIRIVDSLDAALDHIAEFGSLHTEAIITEDAAAAQRFLNEVDAAGAYHNVSTRFADGYRYGFGSEVGISNSKLHARGPMGMEGLTTYKYKLVGNGQVVGTYARGERVLRARKIE